MYIKLIFSKQLTINKCTLLDCTNTEILMYFIYLSVHAFGSVLCTHTLLVQTHTHDVSAPSGTKVLCYRPLFLCKKTKTHIFYYLYFNI